MLGVPDYQVEESGPDHQKSFRATVRVGGQVLGAGQGRTKKAAEQQAAEVAWRAITAESEGLAPENGRENGRENGNRRGDKDDKDDKGEPER
jgi:dsRNA-specific ribonuclease